MSTTRNDDPSGRSRPLRVVSLMMLALAGSAGLARPSADEPLPEATPAQLAAKLREAMGRHDGRGTFRVVFTDTRDMNALVVRRDPGESKPLLVSYRGRARHESDGTRWCVEYESKMPHIGSDRLRPLRWISGFDGARRYDWQVSTNEFILGASSAEARACSPRAVLWEQGDHLVEMLEGRSRVKSSLSIAQRTIDGMRCYAVESKTADGLWGTEYLIAPRQGYLPIERKWTHRGRTYSSRSLRGVHEVAPGIWAPERIEEESTNNRDDGTSRLDHRRRMQVVEYRPGRIPPESAFRVEIPYGVDVTDRPAGFSYRNDPWWPEVGAMLREKFAWPPPDVSTLWTLGSGSGRKLDGQPAPPLRIANWLDARPIDLVALRGKVVLVEFGNVEDGYESRYAPALRALYAAYHPAGLEILSIQPPGSDAEGLRRFVREYRLPYPVVIDEGPPGSDGVTAGAFGIRGRIVAFLIDHEGKVRPAGESTGNGGGIVATVIDLLKTSGARDLKPVPLETPQLPVAAYGAVDQLFNARFKEALDADPSGRIAGRIVDGDRKPISGASIRVTPRLTILLMNQPGSSYLVNYRATNERFSARSDADGRFELSGLCKGGYVLKVEAPGLAWAEREVFLGPDLKPASAEFILDQRGAIAGEVRDPQGRPIARAIVMPTWRQVIEDGAEVSRSSLSRDGVTTGESGRFRLDGLQQGHYILAVKADGFKDREVEAIPVGDETVIITLERSP